jgi:hypothetical protein
LAIQTKLGIWAKCQVTPNLAFGGNLALPSLTIDGQTIHIENTTYSCMLIYKNKAICCDKTQKTLRKKSESNVHRIFKERLPQTRNNNKLIVSSKCLY